VANGVVYVGSGKGNLLAFTAECSDPCLPIFLFKAGEAIRTSPAVSDGVVYAGSIDFKLYALGLSNP
jgi:outer membrane protein assembly factor BamB